MDNTYRIDVYVLLEIGNNVLFPGVLYKCLRGKWVLVTSDSVCCGLGLRMPNVKHNRCNRRGNRGSRDSAE